MNLFSIVDIFRVHSYGPISKIVGCQHEMFSGIIEAFAPCDDQDNRNLKFLLIVGVVSGLIVQSYPVQRLALKFLLFDANVGIFLPILGIQSLHDAEDHEHGGRVNALFRLFVTRSSAGLSLIRSLFSSVGSKE